MKEINVAIIGCGQIGMKRAKHLSGCILVACADPIQERAIALAKNHLHCTAYTDWREALAHPHINLVIVATHHIDLPLIGLTALKAHKHILIEKPGGRRAHELDPLLVASKQTSALVKIGLNHRYHPAFRKARLLVDEGALGELMYIRARYGHGGRLGYHQEWRANPALSGGGELIDQGIHLIDLAQWFLGEFTEINGHAFTYFWDMPVEDNGFLLLKTAKNQIAFLHASCTEWKNLFSFEIYGQLGKLDIQGLGGSYGTERLTFYKMLPEMGPPETTIWEYPQEDDSFAVEFAEFLYDINHNRQPVPSIKDAQSALNIIETIYRKSAYDSGS